MKRKSELEQDGPGKKAQKQTKSKTKQEVEKPKIVSPFVQLTGDDTEFSLFGPALQTWNHEQKEYRLILRHGLYLIWDGELVDVGSDKAFAEQCWEVRKKVVLGTHDSKAKLPISPPAVFQVVSVDQ
jgi:hypothetical protein